MLRCTWTLWTFQQHWWKWRQQQCENFENYSHWDEISSVSLVQHFDQFWGLSNKAVAAWDIKIITIHDQQFSVIVFWCSNSHWTSSHHHGHISNAVASRAIIVTIVTLKSSSDLNEKRQNSPTVHRPTQLDTLCVSSRLIKPKLSLNYFYCSQATFRVTSISHSLTQMIWWAPKIQITSANHSQKRWKKLSTR